MSIINDIRACLDTHLANTPSIPSVARQNVPFDPVVDQPFVKTTLIPTLRRPAVRGLNPQQRYEGIYLILICTPEGDGPGAGYDIADLILDRFNSATDVTYISPTDSLLLESGDGLLLEDSSAILLGNPLFVSIDYSEVRGSFLDSPYYCTPLEIAWYTYK